MAHPVMYDDGDRHDQRVRELALALPEAALKGARWTGRDLSASR